MQSKQALRSHFVRLIERAGTTEERLGVTRIEIVRSAAPERSTRSAAPERSAVTSFSGGPIRARDAGARVLLARGGRSETRPARNPLGYR